MEKWGHTQYKTILLWFEDIVDDVDLTDLIILKTVYYTVVVHIVICKKKLRQPLK